MKKLKNQSYEEWKKYWAAYWLTVVKCTARLDGITEIHYRSGFVEFLDMWGRRISISKKNKTINS